MNEPTSEPTDHENGTDDSLTPGEKKIIRRLGGHHLIFRLKKGPWWMIPKPYVLVSSIRGPLWVFYGIGQIWITHKKVKEIKNWSVRVPRFINKRLLQLVDRLEPEIEKFIDYCETEGLTATLVIERKIIECHWTMRQKEKKEEEADGSIHQIKIDERFNLLAQKFVEMQLVEPADI